MYKGKKILALIPARGRSVGLPRKNIKMLGNKPMIAYAIQKALFIKTIDRVIVTTEDPEIADIAKTYGAEVPFLRDPMLAQNDTPMLAVIIDAINHIDSGQHFDYAIMLQANSPLTRLSDIVTVIEKITENDVDVVFTVTKASHPPQWSLTLEKDSPRFAFLGTDERIGVRRQDEDVLYRSTGAVFAVRVDYLLKNQEKARLCLPSLGQRTAVVITDNISSIDIDNELDFFLAETILYKGMLDE